MRGKCHAEGLSRFKGLHPWPETLPANISFVSTGAKLSSLNSEGRNCVTLDVWEAGNNF